jgi:hypothetical protein
VSVVPALAAAMAALLARVRPVERASAASEWDERCLWLVTAALALLVR